MESRAVFRQNNVEITDVDAGYISTIGLGWETPVKGLKLNYTMYNLNDFEAEGKSAITTGVGANGMPYSYAGRFKYKTTEMWGLIGGFEYSTGDLLLAGEYMKSEYKARGDVFSALPVGEFETSLPAQGWYLSGSYRFTDLFSAALTYSDYIPNTDDRDGDEFKKIGEKDFKAWLKTITVSTRFDINPYLVFKLEASQNNGWGHHDPLGVPDKGLKEDWTLLSAKLTVNF